MIMEASLLFTISSRLRISCLHPQTATSERKPRSQSKIFSTSPTRTSSITAQASRPLPRAILVCCMICGLSTSSSRARRGARFIPRGLLPSRPSLCNPLCPARFTPLLLLACVLTPGQRVAGAGRVVDACTLRCHVELLRTGSWTQAHHFAAARRPRGHVPLPAPQLRPRICRLPFGNLCSSSVSSRRSILISR